MKRFFASIALVLTISHSPVYALSGGPFDNGFQSAALENNSIYQAILNYSNGSGFCYFYPKAVITSSVSTLTDVRGSTGNRMVLYYKGITYIGSAIGTTDQEARQVQCSLNGGSEANQTQITNNTQTGASTFNNAANATALASIILSSSRSFTVNGNFHARITQNAPTLRFTGKGELAFLAPNGQDSVAGLAFTGYSGLINAIVTAVGNANVGQFFDPTVFTDAQTAIKAALTDLLPVSAGGAGLLAGASLDATYGNAEIVKMTVVGTRRYL